MKNIPPPFVFNKSLFLLISSLHARQYACAAKGRGIATALVFIEESRRSQPFFDAELTFLPLRKRGLPAHPRPCLCHNYARVKNPCFFPLALPFFLSQARPSDDRYLLKFILIDFTSDQIRCMGDGTTINKTRVFDGICVFVALFCRPCAESGPSSGPK